MASPPQQHSTSYHNVCHCSLFALHAPHRIAMWRIASILFVRIAYRFMQYGNAEHWIASPHLALYRPRAALHARASHLITLSRLALAHSRSVSRVSLCKQASMAPSRSASFMLPVAVMRELRRRRDHEVLIKSPQPQSAK